MFENLTKEMSTIFRKIYDFNVRGRESMDEGNDSDFYYCLGAVKALSSVANELFGRGTVCEDEDAGGIYNNVYVPARNLINAKYRREREIEGEHPEFSFVLFGSFVDDNSPDWLKEYDRVQTDRLTLDRMLHDPDYKPEGYEWDAVNKTFVEIKEED